MNRARPCYPMTEEVPDRFRGREARWYWGRRYLKEGVALAHLDYRGEGPVVYCFDKGPFAVYVPAWSDRLEQLERDFFDGLFLRCERIRIPDSVAEDADNWSA